jgi:radical SAM protein with 4Fe4S-binding SPASM domain
LPFCSYKSKKTEEISNGALSVDGHIRYAIDPRGFAKPDYYIDKKIGDPLDIKGCWNNSFMKEMRNLKLVPEECKNCRYLLECRGGSRFSAKAMFGSYSSGDPLMNKNEK